MGARQIFCVRATQGPKKVKSRDNDEERMGARQIFCVTDHEKSNHFLPISNDDNTIRTTINS